MVIRSGTTSYLPTLYRCLMHTRGNILELGTGLYSTAFLHWMAIDMERHLFSYEDNKGYYRFNHYFTHEFHHLTLVSDWDEIPLDQSWSVALVDHNSERRAIDAIRLADWASLVVLHDTEPIGEQRCNWKTVYPYYEYRYDYKKVIPNTTVLSNFDNLEFLHGNL